MVTIGKPIVPVRDRRNYPGSDDETRKNRPILRIERSQTTIERFRSERFSLVAEGVVDRREGGLEVRADALQNTDNSNADQHGDQAVLDRGGARLVLNETRNEIRHFPTLQIDWSPKPTWPLAHPKLSQVFGAELMMRLAVRS